ncbi:MAG: 3-deoxy-8-phosphooctulonate synthase [Opitutales bacterium]|nr:3-deoxy-8-phosphooctulonate synthase [Opitutales bacterium]
MIYDSKKFLLIAGPCSLENENVCRTVAEELCRIQAAMPELTIVFKGSFDKANRTSISGLRGPGIDEGLALLSMVKKEYKLPVLTDVHEAEQCVKVGGVCDVLQIPAFLCRQTDLLVAAAKTGRCVNVKKGQFLSPQEMRYVNDKLTSVGAKEVWLTDRGTSFGYQNLVVDMRSFQIMNNYGRPSIMDATHSVQLPGAMMGASGGQREFVPALSRAAVAAGAKGLFVETHPDPANAISDAATQLPLAQLHDLLKDCVAIWKIVK